MFAGTSGGTVQVASPGLQIAGLQFATGGYVLADAGGSLSVGAGGAEVRIDPSLTATIAAPITGAGGITKTGAGTIILTGADDYEGGTTINAGTLQIGNGGSSGSIVGNIVDNAALVFSRSATSSLNLSDA